ncbi:MAG: hypothetical protein ABIP55_08860, partial [Tepidisphaeraceae bacterium]
MLTRPTGARARRWGEPLALAAVTLIVFLLGLGASPIVTSHEARVAVSARAMAESGWPWRATPMRASPPGDEPAEDVHDGPVPPSQTMHTTLTVNPWGIPVYFGKVRLQKPPLPYWCAAMWMRLIGPGAWAARLTPALMG